MKTMINLKCSLFVLFMSNLLMANAQINDKNSELTNWNIKVLLILPANMGANFNYNIDILEEFGFEITTAGIDSIVSPCPWGTSLGLEDFRPDTLISEIQSVEGFDALAIMPSSWQAVSPAQAYLDLMNDTHCIHLIYQAAQLNKVIWATCAGSRVLAAANIINGIHVQGKASFKAEIIAAGGIYMADTSLPIIENNIVTCAKDMWYCYPNTEALVTALEMQSKNFKSKVQSKKFRQTPVNIGKGEVEWAFAYGAELSEGIKSVCFANHSYFMVGNSFSSGAGLSDIVLIRTDSLGQQQWSKTYGGQAMEHGYDVISASHGGLLICGYTTSSGAGGKDMYIVKTDINGNVLWSKTYGGAGLDIARSIVETGDGHYLIFGYTESYDVGKGDMYLIKTDTSGNVCWLKTYGGTNAEMGRKIRLAADGNYLLLGLTGSKGAGKSDYNLIKTDTSGNILWDKTYGNSNYQEAFDVIPTSDNGYVMVGHSDIHGSDLNQMYVVKTDGNGVKLWEKYYGSSYNYYDYGRSVIELNDGKLVFCGNTKMRDTRKNDAWIVITDANGTLLWNDIYGGDASDWAAGMMPAIDGGFVFAGYTMSFGAGSFDAWMVKVSNPGVFIRDIQHDITNKYLKAHPNPFSSTINISVYIPTHQSGKLSIIDITGKTVKVFPILHNGIHHLVWDGIDNTSQICDSGIYFIKLQLSNQSYMEKILRL